MKKNRIIIFVIVISILLFGGTKIIFLDRDVVPNSIGQLQPLDEQFYNIGAFNLYQYGTIGKSIDESTQSDAHPASGFFQNIITALFLKVFGNNYWGMRCASVFASFLVILISCLLFFKLIKEEERKSNTLLLVSIFSLFIVYDFSLSLISRIAEPTIFRLLSLQIVVLFWFLFKNKIDKYYVSTFLGFISTSAVLFVYTHNLFIINPLVLYTIILNYRKGVTNIFCHLLSYLAGFIIALAFFDLTLRMAFHINIVGYITSLSSFTDRIAISGESGSIITRGIKNLFNVFATNIFRLNPPILFAFLVSIPIFIWKALKKQSFNLIFIGLIIGSYIIQSFFINDFPFRKGTIILPFILIFTFLAVISFFDFIKDIKKTPKLKYSFYLYILFSMLVIIGLQVINFSPKFFSSYYLPKAFLPISLISILLITAATIFAIIRLGERNIKMLSFLFFISLILTSTYLNVRHIWSKPSFTYRDTMIELGNHINGEYITGGLGYSFRLYNTSKPVLNAYLYREKLTDSYFSIFDKLMVNKKSKYTILYETGNYNPFHYKFGTYYTDQLRLVKKYHLDSPGDVDIALYEYTNIE